MLLWIGFAVLMAAVVGFLARPLLRPVAPPVAASEADLAVYRDQLKEIETDRDRGLLGAEEAESARAEIARRLLQRAAPETAEASQSASDVAATPASHSKLTYGALASLPVLTIGVYLMLGSPFLPSQPLSGRFADTPQNASVAQLVAQVEARLKEHPEDGHGWDAIAPVYMRLGRYADAANAFSQANRLLGETPQRLLGFSEATLLANDGVVTEEVRRGAERVIALEPNRMEPRAWLALAKEQDGKLADALADYRAIIAGVPADAPWRKAVEERIQRVEQQMGGKPASETTPQSASPTPADVAEAQGQVQSMSPEDQAKFIESMVTRLAERLKTDGKDLEGWRKLIRAYQVMGRKDDAAAALAEARRQFTGEAGPLGELEALAKNLGLGS